MTVERSLRLIAGTFVLLSLALGYWIHPAFYLFTAFVGLNLFQSGLTDWCLMKTILQKLGLPDAKPTGRCETGSTADRPSATAEQRPASSQQASAAASDKAAATPSAVAAPPAPAPRPVRRPTAFG